MDIVAALSFYRLSVVEDPVKFLILHILYKDGAVEQQKLEELSELEDYAFKSTIREMYQANLVKPHGRFALTLTYTGWEILARFGADNNVAPFLIDEIAAPRSAQNLRKVVQWAFQLEPEDASVRTASLRNLKKFISNKKISDSARRSIIYWCLSPPEASRTHTALINATRDADLALLYFSGHGSLEETEASALVLDGFEEASHLYRSCSRIFVDACKSGMKPGKRPQRDALAGTSFRVWNYLEGMAPDLEIELAVGDDASGFNQSIWKLLWKEISPLLEMADSGTAGKSRLAQDISKVKDEHDLYVAVKKKVQIKRQIRRAKFGYHVVRSASPLLRDASQDNIGDVDLWWSETEE